MKVINFGLAKSVAEDAGGGFNTHTTGFLGTPLFASPEQCDEVAPDIRSDIYSLGLTLWYLLTGRAPYSGKLHELLAQQLHTPPPWIELPADVPECLKDLLGRMLAKERAERPQTPAELRADLEACLAASGGQALATASPAPRGLRLDDCLREVGGCLPTPLVAAMLRPLSRIADAAGSPPLRLTPGSIRIATDDPGAAASPSAPFSDARLTAGRPAPRGNNTRLPDCPRPARRLPTSDTRQNRG